MTTLSKEINRKVIKKFKKTLKNPKEKRMKRLSCYVKLLMDILQKDCNKSIDVNNIINNIYSKYNPKVKTKKNMSKEYEKARKKKNGFKNYLEYLLTNKTISDKELIIYKSWFKNDALIISAIESAINSLNCNSLQSGQSQSRSYGRSQTQRYIGDRRYNSYM